MIRLVLRGIAAAIAIAAAIDPAVTMTARGRGRIAVMVQEPELEGVRSARARLDDLLRADFDVVDGADAKADAVVVVGSEYPEPPPPTGQRAFTVSVAPGDREPSIRVSALRIPREAAAGSLIHLEVDVEGHNVSNTTSTVVVRTGKADLEVAHATHRWSASPERWRAALDVTPLDQSPWRFHVDVSAAPGERMLDDNVADAMVAAAQPLRVLMYEPRLSWAGTFVRRALERDPRFDVATVAFPSRGVRVTSADAALPVAERTRAVILGGLDRVTAEDALVLSRFVSERGGVLVVLPDSRSDAQAAARWLPIPTTTEILLEQPARLRVEAPLPPIEASELLALGVAPALRALASSGANAPVIAVAPVGAGQLVISGALDAWRFRANDRGAFDRFWQAAIAGLASATPAPIDVEVSPSIVSPGGKADVLVRVRRAAIGLAPVEELRVSAMVGDRHAVRLWPGDSPDTFHGSFLAPTATGAGRVTVAASDRATGAASFVVAARARSARPPGFPLSLLADTRGGIDVAASDVTNLARRLRQELAVSAARAERRPMRSAWWLLPFAACLGGEWWLRRRRGLR